MCFRGAFGAGEPGSRGPRRSRGVATLAAIAGGIAVLMIPQQKRDVMFGRAKQFFSDKVRPMFDDVAHQAQNTMQHAKEAVSHVGQNRELASGHDVSPSKHEARVASAAGTTGGTTSSTTGILSCSSTSSTSRSISCHSSIHSSSVPMGASAT